MMFDYPLLSSQKTAYDKLGIYPCATEKQITDVISNKRDNLIREQKKYEKKKNRVFKEIPDLEPTLKKIELASKKTKDREKINAIIEQREQLEKQAMEFDPDYKDNMAKVADFEKQVSELNVMKLDNIQKRKNYDQSHPPCALLKLKDESSPVFVDPDVALYQIRMRISRFLEKEKGVGCYHPSDLTRSDFTSDFNYNPELDEE